MELFSLHTQHSPSITETEETNKTTATRDYSSSQTEATTSSKSLDEVPSIASAVETNTEINEDAVSFGIRSFTVEVATNEKLLSTTNFPLKANQLTEQPGEGVLTTTPAASRNSEPSKKVQLPESHEDSLLQQDISTNEVLSGVRGEEKLKNGLYRVQLGEIITDEFNPRSDFNKDESEQDNERLPADVPVHLKPKLVNIDDFFPSKVEDFTSTNGAAKENDSTTNIEIELIEEKAKESETQKTVIPTHSAATPVTEVAPVTKLNNLSSSADNFKRVKKYDPSIKSNTQGPQRIHDFGMTKFKSKSSNGEKVPVSGNPEFSTTKFYNSKEYQSDMILKKKLNVSKPQGQDDKEAQEEHNSSMLKSQTITPPTSNPRTLSRLEEKLNSLDCDIQNLSADSTVWRGNETHELSLPTLVSLFGP
jgi:hypothetical protein